MLNTFDLVENDNTLESAMFRSFIHTSGDLYSSHSLDGRFLYASPASHNLLGFGSEELNGMSLYDLCHPEDLRFIENLFNSTNLGPQHIYFRVLRKEGDYIWFKTTSTLFKSNGEQGFFCISKDVTAFKMAEKELKEKKEKFRLLIDNFQDTVGLITEDGFWIHMNNTGRKLFGVTLKEEMIGKCLFDYIHPDDREKTKTHMISDLYKEPIECTIFRSDGKFKYVEIKFIPSIYKDREVYQIVIRDLTERKEAEYIMQRTEKLYVVGQLAAGIAHEIRNPLTVIKGFTQLVMEAEQNKYLDVVMKELERVESIVSDLLFLAKPQISTIEKVNLQKVLEDTITLFYSESLLHNIEMIQDIYLPDPFIKGEANKLKQVYINLIKNAIEAMPKGGKIMIKAKQLNEKILTQVIDEGIGVPDNLIEKLDEPFYSTKEKGTGLGLMICNQIIKNHRGTITIESEPNHGTTVSIQLPKNLELEI